MNQQECQRCGSCCTSGGPALHSEDMPLVQKGNIPLAQLITIRKGELTHNPLTNSLQPVKREFIKISGVGKKWNCLYFDPEEKGCTIYDMRPKACKALECWNTTEIEALIEQDTLCRLDLIDPDDPLRPLVEDHEKRFPCPDIRELMENGPEEEEINRLEKLANQEILFRAEVVKRHDLCLGEELFYFGRPLFHLFISIGANVTEVDNNLIINWPTRVDRTQGK